MQPALKLTIAKTGRFVKVVAASRERTRDGDLSRWGGEVSAKLMFAKNLCQPPSQA
jgi:hypothetical protein